jgi:exo-beta-1,3-glucanase (GH17 family)
VIAMRVGFSLSPAVPLLLALCAGAAHGGSPRPAVPPAAGAYPRQEPFVTRPFRPFIGERWVGNAIAYGPHRDGQYPGGPSPSRGQLREDLRLMSPHWGMLRTYGAAGWPETLLAIIHEERIPMRVMLGVWVEPEARRDSAGRVVEELPRGRAANRADLEAAVRLAARYPEVVALCVGNETQVSWSANRVPLELLVGHVREARARTKVPVTSADDIDLWNEPVGHALAKELDLVDTHIHPLWRGQQLADAADYTSRAYRELSAAYPGRTVVIGETGWATSKIATGDQGKLMKGAVGEAEQAAFCTTFAAWAERERVVTIFFEAFDENWKGGPDPGEVEKHWGFFRADRTPKSVVAALGR